MSGLPSVDVFERTVDVIVNWMTDFTAPRWMNAQQFDGAEPFMPEVHDTLRARASESRRLFFPSVAPTETGPIDVRLMNTVGEGSEVSGAGYGLTRINTVGGAALRGRVRGHWRHVVRVQRVFPHLPPGKYRGPEFLGYRAGRWHNCTNLPLEPNPLADEWYNKVLPIAHSLHFTRDYEWLVKIGKPGGVRIGIVTDPDGAREVFRLRDIPPGASRRSALRHWVSQHWRRTRMGDDALVREHLRGALRFHWSDLDCEIVPSPFDLRKARAAAGNVGSPSIDSPTETSKAPTK